MTTGGLVKVTITLTAEQDAELDRLAADGELTRSHVMRQVIEDGLKVARVKRAAGAAAVQAVAS